MMKGGTDERRAGMTVVGEMPALRTHTRSDLREQPAAALLVVLELGHQILPLLQ